MSTRRSIGAAAILGLFGAAALGGCDVVAGIGTYCTEGKDPGCGGAGGTTATTTGGGGATTTTGGGGATTTGGTGGTTTTGGGGTGGMLECSPVGATEPCYDGPDGTVNVGICRPGMHQCMSTNMWGQCMNEILPAPEDCANPDDENCDFGTGCSETVWSKIAGDGSNQLVYGLAYDAEGNLYAVGRFAGTLNFGNEPLISSGSDDAFVVKLDPLGNRIWSKRFGDAAAQGATGVAVDDNGDVVVVGELSGSMEVDLEMLQSAGGTDGFALKLDSSGNKIWARRFGDAGMQQQIRSVAIDKTTGEILLSGNFNGTLDFDGKQVTTAGGQDAFVAKLSSQGVGVWAKRFGDAQDQYGMRLATDQFSNIFLAGQFFGSMDFGPGNLLSNGAADVFLARLDKNGATSWAKMFNCSMSAQTTGLTADSAGDVVVAIETANNIDVGGGMLTLTSYDVVLAKYSSGGIYQWNKQIGAAGAEYGPQLAADANNRIVLSFYSDGPVDVGGGNLPPAAGLDLIVAGLEPSGSWRWAKRYGAAGDQSSPTVTIGPKGQIAVGSQNSGTINFGPENLMSAGGTDVAIAEIGPN